MCSDSDLYGGLEIETRHPVFDPGTAMLMDFRCGQSGAAHFTYVLPFTAQRALVEDTWFARAGLQPPDHRETIRDYLLTRYGVRESTVFFVEQGALPMDPVFEPPRGKRLIAFGSAGAATRPSTGYAFNTVQAQRDVVAADLAAGRLPQLARPRPRTVRMMDAVLLKVLARRPELAPRVFASLFEGWERGNGLTKYGSAPISLASRRTICTALPLAITKRPKANVS